MTTPLAEIIQKMIAAHGPMDLATYMNLCLAHPEHGYYTTASQVFGARGDFTTAPEISQLFGEMIGFWLADLWGQMGKPGPFILAELGPGRGTLMADVLRILSRLPGMVAAMRVHLVEISDIRIAEQARALHGYDVTWHDQIDDLPRDAPIIIINNEFFDALPVRQVVRTGDRHDEIVVGLDGDGNLALGRRPIPFITETVLADGAVYEPSPARDVTAQALFARLSAQGGAVLTIDYGYDTPIGTPTVQAVQDHQPVDILHAPGQCDVTALVDFGRLADLARAENLRVFGPVSQGDFLRKSGIVARAEKILQTARDDAARDEILSGLARLTEGAQMGTLFRVLAAVSGPDHLKPAGFA